MDRNQEIKENRHFWRVALTVGFSILGAFWGIQSVSSGPSYPLPGRGTLIVEGEREDGGEAREKWFREMHRSAPGTHWEEMDAETREEKYFLGFRRQENKTQVVDTFANGNIIGEWTEKGSQNQAGRVHLAEFDLQNGYVFAGADGGQLFRGNLTGTGWTPLNDHLKFNGFRMLRVLPHNSGSRIMVATGGSRFYFSDDGGLSWNVALGLGDVESWGWIHKAVVMDDVARTIYLLATEWDWVHWEAGVSLYVSTNQGGNFSKVGFWQESLMGSASNYDLWTSREGESPCYLIRADSIFSLAPGSGTLVPLGGISLGNGTGTSLLSGTLANGDTTLYAWVEGEVSQSLDGGRTWTNRGTVGTGPFFHNSWGVSLTNPNLLWFGDVECHKSTDGGNTWSVINTWPQYYSNPSTKLHADIPAIIPFRDSGGNERQFICTDGGLFQSQDMTQSVQNLSLNGLNCSQYYSVYTYRNNHDYIYAGSQDQGFQRSSLDGGGSILFDQVISGDYGHIVSGNGGQSIFMNYPGFTEFYSFAPTGNGVASWNFNGTLPLWLPPLMGDPDNPSRAYLAGGSATGGSGSHIIQLEFNGTGTLSASNLPYDFSPASASHLSALGMSPVNHNRWFAGTANGDFFFSTDRGQSWTHSFIGNGPGAHYFYGNTLLGSPSDELEVWYGGSGYSDPPVFRSTDGGMSFGPASVGLPNTLVYDLDGTPDGQLIFAATELGPYVYVRSEGQWFDLGGGYAPDQIYWSVDYLSDVKIARFGTYGRGIWDFQIQEWVGFTEGFALQNIDVFPNPASEFAKVRFETKRAGDIEIKVIDNQGKTIWWRTLFVPSGISEVQVGVGQLPGGTYWIQVGDWEARPVQIVH